MLQILKEDYVLLCEKAKDIQITDVIDIGGTPYEVSLQPITTQSGTTHFTLKMFGEVDPDPLMLISPAEQFYMTRRKIIYN